MVGKNIKASVFTGHDSGGYATTLTERFIGLDSVVNMAYAYVVNIPLRDEAKRAVRPVKVWEIATAYALWSLRNSPQLQGVESLPEYAFPEIDLDPLKEFLTDLEDGAVSAKGPLAEFCRVRVTHDRLKDSDESSFAQVVKAMNAYLAGDVPVDPSFCSASVTGKKNESGAKFTSFGGADRGPVKKEKKATDE
jgi:hypothetical protein